MFLTCNSSMRTCIVPSQGEQEKKTFAQRIVRNVYSTLAMGNTRNGIMEKGVSMADDCIHYQLQFLPPRGNLCTPTLNGDSSGHLFLESVPSSTIGCHGNQGYQLDDTSLSSVHRGIPRPHRTNSPRGTRDARAYAA